MSDSVLSELSEDSCFSFWCPGCKLTHSVRVLTDRSWWWNGSFDKPTFTPSILETSGHYAYGFSTNENCWCNYKERYPNRPDVPESFRCFKCHCIVTDGKIHFLSDCAHELANTVVDMVPYEEAKRRERSRTDSAGETSEDHIA